MRVTEVHNQILALLSDTVTNALNAQLLLEAIGNTNNHVVNQAAGETVQCAVVLVVVRTGYEDFVALYRDGHVRMKFAGKGCLSALHGNNAASILTSTPAGMAIGILPIRDIVYTSLTIQMRELHRRHSAREPSCRS